MKLGYLINPNYQGVRSIITVIYYLATVRAKAYRARALGAAKKRFSLP